MSKLLAILFLFTGAVAAAQEITTCKRNPLPLGQGEAPSPHVPTQECSPFHCNHGDPLAVLLFMIGNRSAQALGYVSWQ